MRQTLTLFYMLLFNFKGKERHCQLLFNNLKYFCGGVSICSSSPLFTSLEINLLFLLALSFCFKFSNVGLDPKVIFFWRNTVPSQNKGAIFSCSHFTAHTVPNIPCSPGTESCGDLVSCNGRQESLYLRWSSVPSVELHWWYFGSNPAFTFSPSVIFAY